MLLVTTMVVIFFDGVQAPKENLTKSGRPVIYLQVLKQINTKLFLQKTELKLVEKMMK